MKQPLKKNKEQEFENNPIWFLPIILTLYPI
jgi:hypothetical protein